MGEKESVKECTDHRAWNDASCSGSTDEGVGWGTTEETVPSGFSGISKKQFTDFSWRSDVEENWRTTGQSTAFHAAPRLRVQKILSLDFSSSSPPISLFPWHSSLESVHFVGNLVGINSWFRRRNNTSGRIVNLNFTSFFFSFVFPLLCVTLIFFIARIKKMFLLRFFRAVN